jgi:mono/diheme cytochrome c family protein
MSCRLPGRGAAALAAFAVLGTGLAAGCQQSDVPRPGAQAQASPGLSAPASAGTPAAPVLEVPSPAAGQQTAQAPAAPAGGQPPAAQPAGAAGGGAVPSSPESIQRGQQLFAQNCASCHGPQGKGDGPAAVALNPKPADLTDAEWKHGGSPQQIYSVITNGVPGTAMVPWASIPEQGRWDLTNYVKSLSGGK